MERSDYSEQVQTKRSTSKNPFPPPKRKINDNTKRFSDEQVKSLECMFNRGAKLEPRNKLQLAQDLGLQPRQVSIWFQNKRARWKSKKMEQEYRILKANFDALYQQFESLKQDKESLLEQLQTLNSLLEDPHRRHSGRNRDSFENGIKTAPANIDKYIEYRENNERAMNLDVDRVDINIYDGQKEEPELLISEQGDRSTASQKEWCNLVSSGPSDEPCCPSNWWDF